MANNLRKFLDLPPRERRQLLLAACLLPPIHLRLKYLGLQSCLRGIGLKEQQPETRRDPPDAALEERARACECSVMRASRHGLVAGTCLSRSLTLLQLLAREGIAGRLRIGVDLAEDGGLDAHAWVEAAGLTLGRGEAKHEPFPPFEAGASVR